MMVFADAKETLVTPATLGAVTPKLLNVFAPVIARVRAVVLVKAMLLKVSPTPAKVVLGPLTTIFEVPALNVKPDVVTVKVEGVVRVKVLEPRFS